MKRHTLILIGILVIQIALSVAMFWPRQAAGDEGEPVFPNLDPRDIVEVTITDGEGNTLHLSSAQGDWVLPDAGDYPAGSESVEPLLEGLAGLTTGRLVTRTEPSHRSLQVADDDFLRRVVFQLAGGATRAVYIGSSPRYGVSHFRVFGQDEVYLTSDLQSWDVGTNATSWVDTSYLTVPRADITRLTLTNPNGTFAFTTGTPTEEGATVWSMEGLAPEEELNNANVVALVNQAASVNMVAPLGREERDVYGLDEPNATVTIETVDDTVTVVVGAADAGDANYVVKASTSPYYVHVSKWNVSYLVDYAREDFLILPPTPLPEDQDVETPSPE